MVTITTPTEGVAAPAAATNVLAPGAPVALRWWNEPASSSSEGGRLTVTTKPSTDAWMRTHYGFKVDNAHFHYALLDGDWVMATTLVASPNAKYDQAGLMVRISPSCWLKTSVEFQPDGRPAQLGVVVTNGGYSDWSTMNFPGAVGTISLRVRREGSDYIVEASLPEAAAGATDALPVGGAPAGAAGWAQLRMAHLCEDTAPCGQPAAAGGAAGGGAAWGSPVAAGVYACSPTGPGFQATWEHLTLFAGRVAAGY